MSYIIKINKLPKSEVEVEAEIPAKNLDEARPKALESISNSVDIPGFRKGKIPEKIILEKVGDRAVLEEAAEIAVNKILGEIIKELNLDIIGRPILAISKLAFGNPLAFKIRVSVMPEFKLPDYKKIASESRSEKKEVKEEATEKEIEGVLIQIRKNKAHFDWHKANPKEVDHSKHPDFDKEENLPLLDDELAKQSGNFVNLAEMKEKVKENIINEKKHRENDKKRVTIMQELVKNTEIDLPEILIENEVYKSLAQIKDDVVRMGGSFDDYLSHIKKTEDEIKKDLRGEAENRAKIQLIFNKIAEAEKLSPDETILTNEINKILEIYPDANEESARIYVTTSLLNSEVLKLLETE